MTPPPGPRAGRPHTVPAAGTPPAPAWRLTGGHGRGTRGARQGHGPHPRPPGRPLARPCCQQDPRRSERGSATVELVLVTPLLLALAMLAVLGGRVAQARMDVDGAARDGARAATIARDPASAGTAARTAADRTLSERGRACRDLTVTADTGAFRPGGHVTVTVTCTTDLSDLTLLHLPGTHTTTAGFTAPVDTYRGITP